MVTNTPTPVVLTTDKEGKEFLDARAVELKQDRVVPPATRAVFQAIVRNTQPKYLTEFGPRDTIGILDIMHGCPVQLEYTYDRKNLYKTLRHQPINPGRTAPPSGKVRFDDVFDAAWKLLAEALDEYSTASPAD